MFLWNIAVTSLAEVWIEISVPASPWLPVRCHFPCGSVDWNWYAYDGMSPAFGHFPCGSVDWNQNPPGSLLPCPCHFPCGSVDWNDKVTLTAAGAGVTSLAEVWIEIERDCQTIRRTLVTSLAEVWIEIASGYLLRCIPDRHFPRGSVDWNIEPFYIWESEE